MTATDTLRNVVAVEALFVSDVQASDHPDGDALWAAVQCYVDRFGVAGCAALVAQEFGEHPDVACRRMRWCRDVIAEVFA